MEKFFLMATGIKLFTMKLFIYRILIKYDLQK